MKLKKSFILYPFLLAALVLSSMPSKALTDVEASSTAGFHKPYKFTENWFADKIPVWSELLKEFKGKPNITYLEIGTYEGRSALWVLENIMTHPSAKLIIVDAFRENTFETFKSNIELSGEPGKFQVLSGLSTDKLREIPLNSVDFAYIDGSGKGIVMISDFVSTWNSLKLNGIMICSRYSLNAKLRKALGLEPRDPGPEEAIQSFLGLYRRYVKVLLFEDNYVVIRKVRE